MKGRWTYSIHLLKGVIIRRPRVMIEGKGNLYFNFVVYEGFKLNLIFYMFQIKLCILKKF